MRARWLFGLATACSTAPHPTYPLCDADGAPACGNIGQVGRPDPTRPTRTVHVPPTWVASAGARDPWRAKPLLAAGVNVGQPIARPLLDDNERPAPGNCVGKCSGDKSRVAIEAPVGGARPAGVTAPSLAGSRIAITKRGTLVVDEDSGALIAVDRAGRNVGSIAIGRGAGLLAYDPVRDEAFVADRAGDRIVVVGYAAAGEPLVERRSWRTPREPSGIALSPDRATVLVTTIADRTLVAYDAMNGEERWRVGLAAEPRGVAIAPDGSHAIVAYLTTGRIDRVSLSTSASVSHVAIEVAARGSQATAHARAAGSPIFLGPQLVVVPVQRHTPIPDTAMRAHASDHYGGGGAPIGYQLAVIADGRKQSRVHFDDVLPRVAAYDGVHDRLLVAALGTDAIVSLEHVSTTQLAEGARYPLTKHDEPRCGPDGLAVDGDAVLVWCSFTRRITRLDLAAKIEQTGPQLIASSWTTAEHTGRVAFHAADARVSARGKLACASCHPDGRTDGLSWLVDQVPRQTPILAGRLTGTAPYKWDGSDRDLAASIASTTKSLSGRGVDRATTTALVAYLEGMLPVRAPSRDPAAIARGRALFTTEGCASCHTGTRFVDGTQHAFAGGLAQADTPSLVGFAASAPYYHDGSAATAEALLRGRAAIHDMADTSGLTAAQIADLTAFLESL